MAARRPHKKGHHRFSKAFKNRAARSGAPAGSPGRHVSADHTGRQMSRGRR